MGGSKRWLVVLAIAGCGSPASTVQAPLGEIIGHVEIDQDVPQTGCRVLVEGTPRAALCDANGQFDIRAIDPGKWNLRVMANPGDKTPARIVATAANAGLITDVGAIRVATPGKIGGHVAMPAGASPLSVISIPRFGVTTSPDPTNHGYVLENVPPGLHQVVLTTESGAVIRDMVEVRSGETTADIDFDLAGLAKHDVTIGGAALVSGSSDKSGITVELVEILAGTVKATSQTDADGTFALPTTQGVYLVRAHRSDRAAPAIVPFVAVFDDRDVALATTLVIPADGDLDGDGIPDSTDDDIDGDGAPNATDAFPDDPAEQADLDGDGVGDSADLDANGDGVIDGISSTPDTDGDGRADFEDNCPDLANLDQLDTDHDGVGDRCDNCPGIANHEQADVDHNGIGDACETCIAGTACTPAMSCDVGITACVGAGAVCQDTQQPAPDGTSCGMGMVCFAGHCGPCVNGDACTTSSGGACVVGVTSCATGGGTCLPTAVTAPDGTTCGTDLVCDSGACVACATGGACAYAPAAACRKGKLSCATGLPQICEDSGQMADDGTTCGSGQFCRTGVCQVCAQDAACSPAAAVCHLGKTSCGTGVATCMDLGANAPDGSPCIGPSMFCSSGACITSPNTLAIVSGAPQTANVGAALAPITVRLADGGGTAIAGKPITIALPPGAALAVAPPVTDSSGQTSFAVRLGPAAGPQAFVVQSPVSPPLTLTMTATAVTGNGMYTVVNAGHLANPGGVPGPGALVHLAFPEDPVFAPDGTLYFSDFVNQVYAMTPGGQVTVVAGGGTGSMFPPIGNGGPATSASMLRPQGLALDSVAHQLYIVENGSGLVRRVDLTTGVISAFAGGGNAPGPGFGDGGAATGAVLQGPTEIVLGPNHTVYIADVQHQSVRAVDMNGVISTAALATSGCTSDIELKAPRTLAVDATGTLFIAGSICGALVGQTEGIVRRDVDGSLHHVAGNQNGTTSNGAEGRNSTFNVINSIAFDTAGNLVVAEGAGNKVRRIDSSTGLVSAVTGTGTAGVATEYADAATAPLSNPTGVAFDHGDLLITDSGNHSIARVVGADRATPTPIAMSQTVASGATEIDRLFPTISAHLGNGGTNYTGLRVEWAALDPSSVIAVPASLTAVDGNALVSARPGLVVGTYRIQAQFRTIHGVDISGSPAVFSLGGTAPAAGTLFTIADVDRINAEAGIPGPAILAHVASVVNLAVASDGSIYFTDSGYRVNKLSPSGIMTLIAGNGSTTPIGDFGQATVASLYDPSGLALDEPNHILYVADFLHDRVRAIDLQTGIITTVAGGQTLVAPYGDGGPATSADVHFPDQLALGSDNALYITDSGHGTIRRVDLASPFGITTFMTPAATCAMPVALSLCTQGCKLAWQGTSLFVYGTICGTLPGGSAQGIIRRDANMALTHIAGSAAGSIADGVAATGATLGAITMGFSSTGDILYTDGNRVRKISGGTVTTIAGSTTTGFSGDYGAATSALLASPSAVAGTAAGHVVIGDKGNNCIREIY